jgi:hypothetical protein
MRVVVEQRKIKVNAGVAARECLCIGSGCSKHKKERECCSSRSFGCRFKRCISEIGLVRDKVGYGLSGIVG